MGTIESVPRMGEIERMQRINGTALLPLNHRERNRGNRK